MKGERLQSTAMGIGVETDRALRFLLPGGEELTRRLSVRTVDRLPAPDGAERAVERRAPDGTLVISIDRLPDRSLRIEAPGHGSHLLAADGREVSSLPPEDDWGWHRLFFAQVLPTAGALQGLELLHASAVAIDNDAIAVVSASGGGKSSLAAHLVAAGARFVTDDVLAIEPASDRVLAYPGPSLLALDQAELERAGAIGRERFRSDKVHVEMESAPQAVPLGRLVFLERDCSEEKAVVERLSPPDPRLLLASTFVAHVDSRRRLEAQLEACAQLAARVPCFRLAAPRGETAASAAAALSTVMSGL